VASPVKEHGRLDPAFTWSSLERATDERLVTLARGGLDVAVEAIVRRYHTALVRHASRFLDPERAEHVVQEALVKGFMAIQDEPKRVHLRSWLFRIVHNEAVNTSRRRSGHDQSRDEEDGEAKSAEYLARVERLRGIVVGINRPAIARAEAVERSREEVANDLAQVRANVEVLIQRARAGLRTASGTLFPLQRINNWFGNLSSPGMRGLVTAGAAAVVVATVAGAATLGRHGGGLDPASNKPAASSSSDSKPRVAGPRREGGTRTTSPEPETPRHRQAPNTAPARAPTDSSQQLTPTVPGQGGVPSSGPAQPNHGKKPNRTKPSDEGNSGEDVIVLGEKKGTTSSGDHSKPRAPDSGSTSGGGP
jgi:DNA-directed RNA polymerase specialized sigma24 family protein